MQVLINVLFFVLGLILWVAMRWNEDLISKIKKGENNQIDQDAVTGLLVIAKLIMIVLMIASTLGFQIFALLISSFQLSFLSGAMAKDERNKANILISKNFISQALFGLCFISMSMAILRSVAQILLTS